MKWKYFLAGILLAVFVAVSCVSAYAASPDHHFALMQCTGLTLTELGIANQIFDTDYGWAHQLTTNAQWVGTYETRVNEFANSLGCKDVLRDGQLTPWAQNYAKVYKRYFGN